MKRILLLAVFNILLLPTFSQSTEIVDNEETVEKVSTGVSEEFYTDNTVVSANKINYLHPYYPATPGDVYDIVYILPSVNSSNSIAGFVDINYDIDLSFIGKVNVKGLIYTEVQELLKKKMQQAYPGSIVNIIIKSTGLFKVILLGEVKRARIVDAMSLTTLEQIINAQTTKYASLRDIEVRSEDGSVNTYDLFKFKRYADKKQNPYLKPNDVITIRSYKRRISISGEIKRPGSYELIDGDNLKSIIDIYSDGYTKLADNRKIIIQKKLGLNESFNDRNIIIDATNRDISLIVLEDFDRIIIPSKVSYNSNIKLSGQVYLPGTFELVEGTTLHDLIYIHGDGFTKLAELSKIEIQRRIGDDDTYLESTIYIDANKEDLRSITLNDFDSIYIPNKIEFSPIVTIQGAISPIVDVSAETLPDNSIGNSVSNRVAVPIIIGNKVSTIIKKMDGEFNLTSDLENAFILRSGSKIDVNIKDVLTNINSEFDIVLENEDIIIIPFRQLKVFVAGSVNSSGAVPFIENRTAEYYIGLAGGFERTENLFGSYSIRNVYGEKVAKDAIISPEDVIWVNRDHPMSYIEEYGGWITTIVSTVVISYQLTDLASTLK